MLQQYQTRLLAFTTAIRSLPTEILSRRLRANANIKVIDVLGWTHKIAMFAEDILLFLSELPPTIPNLLSDFAHYSIVQFTNYLL